MSTYDVTVSVTVRVQQKGSDLTEAIDHALTAISNISDEYSEDVKVHTITTETTGAHKI